jgi:hypothetical protein
MLQTQTSLAQNQTAMAQNQTAMLATLAETTRAHAEFERRHLQFERETADRFARLEAQMAEVIRVLNEHGRLLERLPEVIREKIGFKSQ